MASLKDTLPDTQKLELALENVLRSSLTDFLGSTHTRRQEVRSNLKFFGLGLLFLVAVAVFLYMLQIEYDTLVGRITLMSTMLWLLVLLLTGRDWFMNSRLLAKEMSMALVPILTNVLNRSLLYTNNDEDAALVEEELRRSQLLTAEKLTVTGDDVYHVFGEQEVKFHELTVAQEVAPARRGKPATSSEIFRGVLVVAALSRPVSAATFVSTEGNKYGYGHREFWSTILGQTGIEETELEWNDFEEDLHVATSDPRAAREILTPEFMFDLHHWWLEHRLNIRISFVGDRMYLLLPEQSIEIAGSTTSTKLVAIKRYAWTILRPIWRSLILIEDVPR